MNNLVLAYLAGVLDSDGSIFITRRPPRFHQRRQHETFYASMTVAQVQREAVDLFAATFGGTVVTYQPKGSSGFRGYRLQYRWTIYTSRVHRCLAALSPFLRLKTRQAAIVGALLSTFDRKLYDQGKWLTEAIIQERRRLWEEMRTLHQVSGKGNAAPQVLALL